MAVTGTITITTILFFVIVRQRWQRPLWLALGGAAAFLAVDLAFFAANLTKLTHGAWLPLTIGLVLFTVMITWFRGRELVTEERLRVEGPLRGFVEELRTQRPPVERVPGTGVFMNRGKETAPLSMRACVDHLHSLHEHVLILSLETLPVPRIRTPSGWTSTSWATRTTASPLSGPSTATSRSSTSQAGAADR